MNVPIFGIILVVLICVEEYLLRKVMLAAHDRGMTNGEYVFIYPNLLPSENWERLYFDGSFSKKNNEKALDAYKPLIQVILFYETSFCVKFDRGLSVLIFFKKKMWILVALGKVSPTDVSAFHSDEISQIKAILHPNLESICFR